MFFSKIKDITRFKFKNANPINFVDLQDQLHSGLFNIMETAFANKHLDIKNSLYSDKDISKIIDSYARKNMIIAASTSLIPGPLGILGAIPELMLNFKNQMGMIYDLSCAHDKESFINKDLLLDIPIAALGGNTNLVALQSNTATLTDSPQKVLIGKAQELSKGIIERNVKKSVVQFIPIGGPLLMGIWAKMTTNKIATISNSFLDQSVQYIEPFTQKATPAIERDIQVEKIKGLVNIIEANNHINEDQIAFIGPIIENVDIPQNQKNYLLEEALKTDSNLPIDYQLLKKYEEDDDLIMEMVVMAKRNGLVDELEKQYIYRVANELGHSHEFIDSLL